MRPLLFDEASDKDPILTFNDAQSITVKLDEPEETKQARFYFSRVFDGDSGQHDVFETTTYPLVYVYVWFN